jgi:hypothetical protein
MENELPIEDPGYWRQRAEEARALSEQAHDNRTKALLLDIAETYDRIAKAYDQSIRI